MIDDDDLILSHPDDIYRILRSVQKERRILRIHFENSSDLYNSYLLDINLADRYLMIDSLVPELGNNRLLEQQRFSVTSFNDRVRVSWRQAQLLEATAESELPMFKIAFPDEIYYQQRRQHVRIVPPYATPIQVSIREKSPGPKLTGTLTDLSISGCGAWFSPESLHLLSHGQVFNECQLRTETHTLFSGPVRILHPRLDEAQEKTLCGFAFTQLSPAQNRGITRYLLDLQRQQLKYQQTISDPLPRQQS